MSGDPDRMLSNVRWRFGPVAEEHFAAVAGDMAAGLAELFQAKAAREQRALDPVDLFDLSAALLGAAYNVAMLAGEDHRAGYAEIVRRHAEAISGGAAEN